MRSAKRVSREAWRISRRHSLLVFGKPVVEFFFLFLSKWPKYKTLGSAFSLNWKAIVGLRL
jgi:hypothetical protein